MMDIKLQIEAEKDNIYDTDHFMTLFFNKLSNYNNKMCHYKFISSRSNYNKGAMTMEEVFEALKTVYKSEQAAGTWSDLMPTKHEITMLTTTPIAIIAKNNLLSYQSCLCYFREHSTQAKLTKHTVYLGKWLLDYAATSPGAILTYKKSDMVLAVHSDPLYLNEPAAKS